MPVGRDDIDAAAARIAAHVRRTPVLTVEAGTFADTPVVAKLDQLQPTGAFKVRGAVSLLTGVDVPAAGVVAASGGNFGLAIGWAAARLGHRATIFVPATSPRAKIDRLAASGADVHVIDGFYAEALAAADAFVADTGALSAHAYDQREVVAGQGTLAKELATQADVDTVLVAVGGGGLLAGVAGWYQDTARIVAVETTGTAGWAAAVAAGRPVDIEVSGIAASALGAKRIGAHAWAACGWVDTSIVVTDDDVRAAQRALWDHTRLIAEPGGAAALAALTSGAYQPASDERVAVVVCGANTDPAQAVVTP